MKYEELPYNFRVYCEQKEIPEDRAIAFWQRSKDFREFVEHTLLRQMDVEMRTQQPVIERVSTCNNTLQLIRGYRSKLT